MIQQHNQFLDKTPEMRSLEERIRIRERDLVNLLENIQKLKTEIYLFQTEYDLKIRTLYMHLDDLEAQLFKYRNLSEVVDSHFTFDEAAEVFDETMKSRQARMEGEYRKIRDEKDLIDKRSMMSARDRMELKNLYRKLAHQFHPDLNGGNEKLMIQINIAYAKGDLETLRDLELNHYEAKTDAGSTDGLKLRLNKIEKLIGNARAEYIGLHKSDWYVMKKNFLKSSGKTADILGDLSLKIRRDIRKKEAELEEYKEKFGQTDTE